MESMNPEILKTLNCIPMDREHYDGECRGKDMPKERKKPRKLKKADD